MTPSKGGATPHGVAVQNLDVEFAKILFAVLWANLITVAFVAAVLAARGKIADDVPGWALAWFIIPIGFALVGLWLYGVPHASEPPLQASAELEELWEYMTPEERALFLESADAN